ncbi:MAG: hypothetical protein R3F62_25950 [Planctomycetota bacterium]
MSCCPWPQYCSCNAPRPTPPARPSRATPQNASAWTGSVAPRRPAWERPGPVLDLNRSSDTWEITRDVLLGEVAQAGAERALRRDPRPRRPER